MIRPIVVLGLGNPLMGDDGVGLLVLEELRRCYRFGPNVQLEDGGALGLSLLPIVEDAAALLVLDAVRLGAAPGQVRVLHGEEIPSCLALKISPHQTGFRETLALAKFRGTLPPRLALVGVEIESAEYATPVSAMIQAAVGPMVKVAVSTLKEWECEVIQIGSFDQNA